MNIAFLAKTSTNTDVSFQPITHFPGQTDLLTWCQEMGTGMAIFLIAAGLIFLLYGWPIFKALITVNAAVVGAYIGAVVGQSFNGHILAGGIIGALASSAITWPLMKWAVTVMGGICGSVLGAGLWLSGGLNPEFSWAGALTGLVSFGLLSFILFRGSIIMYTSLQGALLLVLGLFGLLFKYQDFYPRITQQINTQPLMLPLAVVVPAILGLIYQQKRTPGTSAAGGNAGAAAATPAPDAKKK
jgi:hypothetical protein